MTASAARPPSTGETASAIKRSKDTDRVQSVHPAPVDGMNASLDDGRTDETADQGMA